MHIWLPSIKLNILYKDCKRLGFAIIWRHFVRQLNSIGNNSFLINRTAIIICWDSLSPVLYEACKSINGQMHKGLFEIAIYNLYSKRNKFCLIGFNCFCVQKWRFMSNRKRKHFIYWIVLLYWKFDSFFNVRHKSNKCDIQFWTNNNFKHRYVMSSVYPITKWIVLTLEPFSFVLWNMQ